MVSAELKSKGKPGCLYENMIVIEDAISGVQDGKMGSFDSTLGLMREDNVQVLWENGIDIVVMDIEKKDLDKLSKLFLKS